MEGGNANFQVSGVDKHRPSILSENLLGSGVVATRIPYRNSFSDHNQILTQTAKAGTFQTKTQRETKQFSVGKHTPMSPDERQNVVLDKIALLTLKARGKLLPG